jgi:large subunit ribosomal protein L4
MMELTVRSPEGKQVEPIKADDLVFGVRPHLAVVHQALLAQLANRRAGSGSTKTRGEVAGSTAKVRRQKGLGRARLGSIRSPAIRHGGIAFGPKPRSFSQHLPKRMGRLAIRSVLSAKAADGSLQVISKLSLQKPRTKDVVALLGNLGLERSTLLVTEDTDRNIVTSARNLERVKVLPAPYLNVADMLSHQYLLMTVGAVRKAEQLWGGDRALRRRAPIPALEPAVEEAPAGPRARRRRTATPAPAATVEEAPAAPQARRRRTAAPAPTTVEEGSDA